MINYNVNWSIQDGKLGPQCGRIVLYKGEAVKSNGPSRDHNDLITAFAAQYRVNRSDVASHAVRLYWKPEGSSITISPVRKLDEDWIHNHIKEFEFILNDIFAKRK